MRYFCSWSGGKDSCLALHRVRQELGLPGYLVNMLSEDGEHSRSHGLPRRILQAQADALGIPVVFRTTSWEDYETTFIDCLRELSAEGVEAGVFGDIDLQEHREWEERVCGEAGMKALLPIWQNDREGLVREFLDAGYAAIIVTVNCDLMPEEFLGRALNDDTVNDLRDKGIDVSGEGGEFHTFVTDGPGFSQPVAYDVVRSLRMSQYAVLELR